LSLSLVILFFLPPGFSNNKSEVVEGNKPPNNFGYIYSFNI